MRICPLKLRLSQLKQSNKSRFPPNSPTPIRLTPSPPPPNHVKPVCLLGVASICLTHHPALGRISSHRRAAERPDSTEYVFALREMISRRHRGTEKNANERCMLFVSDRSGRAKVRWRISRLFDRRRQACHHAVWLFRSISFSP
jgi:hypothetical protein